MHFWKCHARYMLHVFHNSWLDSRYNIWWWVQLNEVLKTMYEVRKSPQTRQERRDTGTMTQHWLYLYIFVFYYGGVLTDEVMLFKNKCVSMIKLASPPEVVCNSADIPPHAFGVTLRCKWAISFMFRPLYYRERNSRQVFNSKLAWTTCREQKSLAAARNQTHIPW
jgi:hypothetical protein